MALSDGIDLWTGGGLRMTFGVTWRAMTCAAAVLAGLASGPARAGDVEGELPIDRMVGEAVADFTLTDAMTGKPFSLYGLRGKSAAVIVFTGTACPLGNLYMPRIAELARDYGAKNVAFVLIDSNASATAEEVAAHAKSFGVELPVLLDPGAKVADALMAMHTCEALVLDSRAQLRFRGAIDDQYGQRAALPEPSKHYLADALNAVLANQAVETRATSVAGCVIERPDAAAVAKPTYPRIRAATAAIQAAYEEVKGEAPEVGPVNYSKDVAPILEARCQTCHRPGQVGPFSLLSFDDAKRHAGTIYEVVDNLRMPPWHANPKYGHFANDRSLSAKERATLLAWVEQGAPQGDPKDEPAPREFVEGWTIGTPDVEFELPRDEYVAAEGVIPYRRFRVPSGFTEDTWVQAAEARPGDRSVVHHIIVYVDDHSEGSRPEGRHLCGYAPGDMPSVYPKGIAKKIPAGSDFIFEIHYTPIGKVRVDRSKLGLILATAPVEHEAITAPIANGKIQIPAGAADHPEFARHTVREDIVLLSFMPHMHLRGKSFRYTARFPGATEDEILLDVPAYDFNWQSYYTLAEPRKLPKGTVITCEAHYDNSPGNPVIPHPEVDVTWGDQTWEEMMIGYIDYVSDRPLDVKPAAPKAKAGAAASSPALRLLKSMARRQARRAAASNTAATPR